MKKSFNFLVIILIVSFLISCKKDNPTPAPTPVKAMVTGKVLQLNSTTPVPNARVYLYESIWSGGLGGGEVNISKDTAITNSKGEYSFSYTKRSGSEFFVKAYATNYYTNNNTRWPIEGSKQVRDVIITPYSWVTLRVINDPSLNISNYIEIGGDWNTSEDFHKFGKCDTIFTKRVFGNQKTKIDIFYINDNSKVYLDRIDSFYCKGLDTISHSIKY